MHCEFFSFTNGLSRKIKWKVEHWLSHCICHIQILTVILLSFSLCKLNNQFTMTFKKKHADTSCCNAFWKGGNVLGTTVLTLTIKPWDEIFHLYKVFACQSLEENTYTRIITGSRIFKIKYKKTWKPNEAFKLFHVTKHHYQWIKFLVIVYIVIIAYTSGMIGCESNPWQWKF